MDGIWDARGIELAFSLRVFILHSKSFNLSSRLHI